MRLDLGGVVDGSDPTLNSFDFCLANFCLVKPLDAKIHGVYLVWVDQGKLLDTELGQHLGQVRADGANTHDGDWMSVDPLLVYDGSVS